MSVDRQEPGWGPRQDLVLPPGPLAAQTQVSMELPPCLRPVIDGRVVQRPVSDPSLKHYTRAMRAGDPQFEDPATGAAWAAARSQAIDCVLAGISGSPWADQLMLRGSMLLRAWFGDAAREPNDLDFVVTPATWQIDEARTQTMLSGIAETAAEAARLRGGVRIDSEDIVQDDTWTYNRAPGLRIFLTWSADGLPSGVVQLDFAFNEELPCPPEQQKIPVSGGPDVLLRVAPPELSLAWKILWLVTDMYPEGKDLYDAVLLAETVTLPARLLREVHVASDPLSAARRRITERDITELETGFEDDWEDHQEEHPHAWHPLAGYHGQYVQRLATALIPTFAEPLPEPEDPYERSAHLLAPFVAAHRMTYASAGMEGLQQALRSQKLTFFEALVITRELSGRHTMTTEETATAMLATQAWRAFHDSSQSQNQAWFTKTLQELTWPKGGSSVPDVDGTPDGEGA